MAQFAKNGHSFEVNVKNKKTPKEKLGFGLVVLYRQNQNKTLEESDGYISTGNLISVTPYLE